MGHFMFVIRDISDCTYNDVKFILKKQTSIFLYIYYYVNNNWYMIYLHCLESEGI